MWHKFEERTRKHDISLKKQLKAALSKKWYKIEYFYTKTLVESMPKHIKSVIRAKGYPAKHSNVSLMHIFIYIY